MAKAPRIDAVTEIRDLRALVISLADALEDAKYALFDAGLDGEGTPFDRAHLALQHPRLAKLRGDARPTMIRRPDAAIPSINPD